MVLCGLGMQQCAIHNATIQKTTFFELGVYYLSETSYSSESTSYLAYRRADRRIKQRRILALNSS